MFVDVAADMGDALGRCGALLVEIAGAMVGCVNGISEGRAVLGFVEGRHEGD